MMMKNMKASSLLLFLCIFLVSLGSTSSCPYLDGQKKNNKTSKEMRQAKRESRRKTMMKTSSTRNLQQQQGDENDSGLSVSILLQILIEAITQMLNLTTTTTTTTTPPSSIDINNAIAAAKSDIQDILEDDLSNELVRLAFHDCVGGVCDGCIDVSVPDNFGLDDPIADMNDIVENHVTDDGILTRADVWILAAYTALERQQGNNNAGGVSFDLEFVGRPVCNDATGGPERALPSAHLTTSGLTDFFRTQFAFDTRETAAIMGAHTLGRAVQENSGFSGRGGWVPNENRLDNQYYTVLLSNNFQQELQDNSNRAVFDDQFLWRRQGGNNRGGRRDLQQQGRGPFMLNADMALVMDAEGFTDTNTGAVSCTLGGTCPPSELREFAIDFANSNREWLTAFHDAYIKMTNVGCGDGVCTPVV